ncbi:MAG: O-succinylhomoserine sulfhydrylase [Pseudomonadota bacterium]
MSPSDHDPDRPLRPETVALRHAQHRTNEREHSEAIFATSSFVFDDAAHAAALFSGGDVEDNVYSRFTNPTVRAFQDRLAALEGGDACLATASGMAAIMVLCLGTLKQGDHVLAAKGLFGSTTTLLMRYLPRWGIEVDLVPLADAEAWARAVQPNTRLLFVETPTNPRMEAADIAALSAIARGADALLAVDNCFCTPILQRPLELGADVVMHSATKYLDGQGRCVGGALVGGHELIDETLFGFMRCIGASMSPFNAWVFLKGLETLAVRMRQHCENAHHLATWLEAQDGVREVIYPGLASHPQHALITRQQSAAGGMVSFVVDGGQAAAWRLIDGVRLLSVTGNLGDARTTITHPATTTHARLSDAQRADAGIEPGLIRLSVGLEHVDDIQADLSQALGAVS